jgi:hypothetical protein
MHGPAAGARSTRYRCHLFFRKGILTSSYVFTLVKQCQDRVPITIPISHFLPVQIPKRPQQIADVAYRRFPPVHPPQHNTRDQGDLLKSKKILARHATYAYITDRGFTLPDGQAARIAGP